MRLAPRADARNWQETLIALRNFAIVADTTPLHHGRTSWTGRLPAMRPRPVATAVSAWHPARVAAQEKAPHGRQPKRRSNI